MRAKTTTTQNVCRKGKAFPAVKGMIINHKLCGNLDISPPGVGDDFRSTHAVLEAGRFLILNWRGELCFIEFPRSRIIAS